MGITIHYRANFAEGKSRDDLRALVLREGKKLSEALDLGFQHYRETYRGWEQEGVNIHPECESFHIFDGCYDEILRGEGKRFDWSGFTKTQYADIRAHIWVVKMIELIRDSGIIDRESLIVNDEGEYYETHDLERLAACLDENLKVIESIVQILADAGWKREQVFSQAEAVELRKKLREQDKHR